jgi:CRP-like cAMP-binding protein
VDFNLKVIEIISQGQTFAEALMFGEQPQYPVNAVAIDDTYLMSFENAHFQVILRGFIDACFKLLGDMSLRLQAFSRILYSFTNQGDLRWLRQSENRESLILHPERHSSSLPGILCPLDE